MSSHEHKGATHSGAYFKVFEKYASFTLKTYFKMFSFLYFCTQQTCFKIISWLYVITYMADNNIYDAQWGRGGADGEYNTGDT